MADQPGKRRGRPRKVVPDAEVPVERAVAPQDGHAERPVRAEADGRREDPRGWAQVLARLSEIEGVVTGIEVPFDEFPALYETPHYGAPVRRGETFVVTLADGTRKG